jgi:hypothetical protein
MAGEPVVTIIGYVDRTKAGQGTHCLTVWGRVVSKVAILRGSRRTTHA